MIEHSYYLLALILTIACVGLVDYRYKLAFFKDRRRTIVTIVPSILVFTLWDIIGIRLGIFFHGDSHYALGHRITPNFPFEEIFFLFLLSYVSLIIYLGVVKYADLSRS